MGYLIPGDMGVRIRKRGGDSTILCAIAAFRGATGSRLPGWRGRPPGRILSDNLNRRAESNLSSTQNNPSFEDSVLPKQRQNQKCGIFGEQVYNTIRNVKNNLVLKTMS